MRGPIVGMTLAELFDGGGGWGIGVPPAWLARQMATTRRLRRLRFAAGLVWQP